LCHGFTSTEYVFDLGEDRSLARYLAGRGFDVYVVNLRGRGEGASVPREVRRRGWEIADYLRYDVPAIISGVLDLSGADKLIWIGHSMGGILGFWHEAATEDERLAGLVAVSSPARMGHVDEFAEGMLDYCPLIPNRGVLPSESPAKLLAPLAQFWPQFSGWVSNLEDYPQEVEAQYIYNSVPDISFRAVKDFCFAKEQEEMVDRRTGFVLSDNLDKVKVPILVLVGSDDNLAQPHNVYPMYSLAGSADKAWVEFGKKNGFSHNYGHGDILLGNHAQAEVFPVVSSWLESHNPPITF